MSDTADALEVARELIELGVPIFLARPAYQNGERDWRGGTGGSGYHLPSGWQNTRPSTDALAQWTPEHAVCAVMGHGFDLLDIDPRNGGDGTRAAMVEAGAWPVVYGVASTPSGGSHEFVAPLGVRSRDGIRPGLDVKAGVNGTGHGFAFIAPTQKLSKATGEIGRYEWVTKPRAPRGGDSSGTIIASEIETARNGTGSSRREAPVPPLGTVIAQGEHHTTMRDFIWRYRCRLTEREVLALAKRRAADCRPATWTDEMTEREVAGAFKKSPDSRPPYTLTEVGNAERCLDTHGGLLRYCAAIGWLEWDGVCWVECGRGEATSSVVASAKNALYGAKAKTKEAERLADAPALAMAQAEAAWYHASLSGLNIERTEKLMRYLPGVQISTDQLDAHPDLLTFANGTVDLRTGKLRPSSPHDLMTVAIARPYVAGARSRRWDEFLGSCFPDSPEVVEYLQRLTGYGITGSAREQIYVVFHGRGANGKSVFTSTLHSVFGPITKAVAIESLLARRAASDGSAAAPDIAALRAARLVITSEAEHGSRLAEARVKALTGGDPITVRTLYMTPFTFVPSFLILLSTNSLPEIRGRDEGIWRRTKVVDWLERFQGDRADKQLAAKLLEEGDGIVAWAVEGAAKWYADGLAEPESVRARVDVFHQESDPLDGFLGDVFVKDHEGFVTRAEVYEEYRVWATDVAGISEREVWQSKSLFNALRDRDIAEVKHSTSRGFRLRRAT